jgi:hypothetical protein
MVARAGQSSVIVFVFGADACCRAMPMSKMSSAGCGLRVAVGRERERGELSTISRAGGRRDRTISTILLEISQAIMLALQRKLLSKENQSLQ